MIDDELRNAARQVLDICRRHSLKVATAESCTGGLVAAALTEIAGSSDVLDRGFVTYSNDAKQTMLGVAPESLKIHGAVSKPVAEAMARGALTHSLANLTVAITGVAGPGGGTAEKPVGLVHFAAARQNGSLVHRQQRFGDIGRGSIRYRSALIALAMLEQLAQA